MTEKPNVKWEDVAGLENAKESLKEVSQIKVKTTMTITVGCCRWGRRDLFLLPFARLLHFVMTFASFHVSCWNEMILSTPDCCDTHSLTCLLAFST